MDSEMQVSPTQDSADAKVAFRKPSNDAANRKYRRRSPVNGSSSSEESPNRERNSSPLPSRHDIGKVNDNRRGKNNGKTFARDSARNQYGSSGDWHRYSDQHPYKSSYHRRDDYVRSEKYSSNKERDHMKSCLRSARETYADDNDKDHVKSTSQSGLESKDGNQHDYVKKVTEQERSRGHVHDRDHYNKIDSDEIELRSRDMVGEKSSIEYKTYKDKDLSSDRFGSRRRHTNHNTEDTGSRDRDEDGDGRDVNRSYNKGDIDSQNERRDYYKGDRNGREGRGDYYKGDRDGRDDKSEYHKGARDGRDEKKGYYKGDKDEKRDYYKGDRDGRDEKKDYYKAHRDGRDEKRDQRTLGIHRSHHSPSHEEVKGDHNDLASLRDDSVHHLKESSRNDPKEMDSKKYNKEERKKYDHQESNWQYNRDSGPHCEDKYVCSSKGQESPAKKTKLFGMDGGSDHVENVSKFMPISGASTCITSNQPLETAGEATSEQSFVKDSDIDAAKVVALKTAELVNRNLIGTGLSTDQKKKLLWGNRKNSMAEESAHHWDTAMFSDLERQEKFNKLMGVKGDSKVEQKPNNQDASSLLQSEKQKELQLDLEKQYTAGLRRRDGRTVGLGL